MDGLITFLGRAHVVLIHFPLGLLLVAGVLEIVRRVAKKDLEQTVTWLLYIGGGFAILASIAGWILADGETFSGRSADSIEWHRWLGVGTSVVALMASAIKITSMDKGSGMMKSVFGGLVVAAAVGVGATGYFGGNLVHGHDYFRSSFDVESAETIQPATENPADTGQHKIKEAPADDKAAPIDGASEGIAQGKKGKGKTAKIDFKTQIWPILDKSCNRCHNAEKKKGKLRLDKKKYAFKKEGVLVPGKPQESSFYKLVALPQDHDDYMPAKGDPLSAEQVALIKQWIAEGAVWPDNM